MRVLIDTCVVIDAVQNRLPFADAAREIIRASAANLFVGCMTTKSSADIYYLVHKCTHSDKDSRLILSKLFFLFEVVDTLGIDAQRAISSDISDYEDAIMIETAIREEISCIVTRNTQDYQKSSIPVYTPSEFLHLLSE